MENKKEYARNENGEIFVVLNKYERGRYGETCVQLGDFYIENLVYEEWEHLLKIRKKPIDLIEVGDFVNGRLVLQVDYKNQNVCLLIPLSDTKANTNIMWYEFGDIKTILTHEQYEQNAYRLEE